MYECIKYLIVSVSNNVFGMNHRMSGRSERLGKKERFYLATHSIHFNYSYMASDIW